MNPAAEIHLKRRDVMPKSIEPSVVLVGISFCFFFSSRRRHTRLVSDRSSDVCSSDLICHVKDGATRVLLAIDGVPGFNDLFTDAQGRIYTGSMRSNPFAESGPRTPGECYRIDRSEERRVGKEGGSRGGPEHASRQRGN